VLRKALARTGFGWRMGCRPSRAAAAARDADAALAAELELAAAADARRLKVLLLGAGESGKSTVLKQLRLRVGCGYSEAERAALRPVCAGHALAAMRALVARADADDQGAAAGAPAPPAAAALPEPITDDAGATWTAAWSSSKSAVFWRSAATGAREWAAPRRAGRPPDRVDLYQRDAEDAVG
jgi:hypothetical protein